MDLSIGIIPAEVSLKDFLSYEALFFYFLEEHWNEDDASVVGPGNTRLTLGPGSLQLRYTNGDNELEVKHATH